MAGGFTAKYKDFVPSGDEDVWIETGTYRGNGIVVALGFGFRELHTIEVCQKTFQELNPELCMNSKVHRYLGSSRECLRPIIDKVINRNVVFWLDGHYQGESQKERDSISECPLMDELEAIVNTKWQRSVLVCIDDANLFEEAYWATGAGREKFTPADWPRDYDIMDMMQGWRAIREDNILYFYKP
jgi:hypothetical protein